MNNVKDFSNSFLAERLRQGKPEPLDTKQIETKRVRQDWWIDRIAALIAILLLCAIGYIAYRVLQTEIMPYPSVEARP